MRAMPFSVLELRRKSTKFWIDDVNRVGQKNRGRSIIALTTSLRTRVKPIMADSASTTIDFNTENIRITLFSTLTFSPTIPSDNSWLSKGDKIIEFIHWNASPSTNSAISLILYLPSYLLVAQKSSQFFAIHHVPHLAKTSTKTNDPQSKEDETNFNQTKDPRWWKTPAHARNAWATIVMPLQFQFQSRMLSSRRTINHDSRGL